MRHRATTAQLTVSEARLLLCVPCLFFCRTKGRVVVKWRKDKGFTQKQVASLVGVSHGYLSEIENGICELGNKVEKLLRSVGAESVIHEHRIFMSETKKELMRKMHSGELEPAPATNGPVERETREESRVESKRKIHT